MPRISDNPFGGRVSDNPFGETTNIKDTVSQTVTDPNADQESVEAAKLTNFLQQKGYGVTTNTVGDWKKQLYGETSSFGAVNKELTNQLSVEPKGPVKKAAKASPLNYFKGFMGGMSKLFTSATSGTATADIRMKRFVKPMYDKIGLGGLMEKSIRANEAIRSGATDLGEDAYEYWVEDIPEEVKDTLGFKASEAAGQIPLMALYMSSATMPTAVTATMGRMIDEGYQAAIEAGKTEEQAQNIALTTGAINGIVEVAMDRLTAGLGKEALTLGKVGGKELLKRIGVTGLKAQAVAGMEAITETIQSSITQKAATGEVKVDQALEEGLMGYIVSTIAGPIFGGVNIAQGQKAKRVHKGLVGIGLTETEATGVLTDLSEATTQEEAEAIIKDASLLAMEHIGENISKVLPEGREITGHNGGALTTDDVVALREQPEVLDNLVPSEEADLLKKAVNEDDGGSLAEYNQRLVGVEEEVAPQEAPVAEEQEARADGDEIRVTVEADNILREEYGVDPTENPEVRTHASLLQEAKEAGRDINVLLDELKASPRPTLDNEVADIALEKARISGALKENKANIAKAIENKNEADIEKYSIERNSLRKRLNSFTDIARLAKTETGRALSAYNLTLNKKKDLTDHVADATSEKGAMLTDKESSGIETAYDEVVDVEARIEKESPTSDKKSIDEQIAETTENIEQAKRTIKGKKKEKSEKQKELSKLKEIERDQDTIFELLKQLREESAKVADPKFKDDPEGYKATIENLLKIRSESQWWKDLKKSKSKSDKRRVKMLKDTLDNLQAQYDGKFRDIKEKKEDVTPDEILDLKNKIAYIREAMRLEDKIASIDEDIRLIGEGRADEITKTKRREREDSRDEKLTSLHNELAQKRKRLETLKTDLGTSKTMKVFEFQRAMKLSLDSWLLRQGGPSLKSNPFMTLDAWFKSFAGYSESQFYEMQRVMESTQSYKDSKNKLGVVYNDIDAGFEEHQEAINSTLAEKIPPVRGSNRHMVLGVNLLRWNWSKRILNRFPNESQEFYQNAGKFINDLTGRGGLGRLESSARGLTAFFTAPRYTTAKWSNLANMRRAWVEKDGKKEFNKDLAKEIAGQKARMYSGFALMATTLIAMGFEMGTDPEDPLFMKFRKGDVVIDIAPHMTAEIRLAALYAEAFAANSLGIGELEGDYDVDAFNKTLRYAGYKVVPTFGTIMELIEGETIVGEERNILETLALYPMPIMVESMYQDAIKDSEDFMDILTSQIWQFVGAGGGIYEDTKQDFDRL